MTPPPEHRDMVNHPRHYGGDVTYEVIKVCEAWNLGPMEFQVVKYVARAGKKGQIADSLDTLEVVEEKNRRLHIQDLEKAKFYLDRRIAQLKGEIPWLDNPAYVPEQEST